MNLIKKQQTRIPVSIAASIFATAISAQAATVAPHLLVNFDGVISGTTYTMGAGEFVDNGTFAVHGTPSITAGVASLAGQNPANSFPSSNITDGFKYSTTLGSLAGTSWVAETIVSFDSFPTGQRTVIDVQGDTFFRVHNNQGSLQFGYWDGSPPENLGTAPLPTVGTFIHLALVWDATATSLSAYVDGSLIATLDGDAHATPDSSNISFGYFGRNGTNATNSFNNRGIDGSLDAVSFATFTGAFDPDADFQLAIPEPSVALLGGIGLLGLLRRRRA